METDRLNTMLLERSRLEEEKEKFPHLFPEKTWVDDASTLEALGMHIPHKDRLPSGFLKFMPSDFIVEEIDPSGKGSTIDTQSEDARSDEQGNTVYAVLVKCGLSTLEAVEELAKLLQTPSDKIQYAGIKDKAAITSQYISIRGVPKDKVTSISSPHFFLKNIRAGKGAVQKGGLKANKFSILIRLGAEIEDRNKTEEALMALERVKNDGFYNFFYLQRFGSPRLNNYKWGISILKGNYEKAIYGLISDPGLREIPYFVEKRKEIISLAPHWDLVLEKLNEFPLIFSSEITAVSHLQRHPGDFVGALQKIEGQVVLWVSAVGSLLFNRKISSYIMADMEPPETLPLFLSGDKNAWLYYADDLESVGIFPPDFNNLSPFRSVSLKHRELQTKDHAQIHAAEITDEGIAVSFTLGKGEYATTFLSHFVNLVSGHLPEDTQRDTADIKSILGETSSERTLEYFKGLSSPKE